MEICSEKCDQPPRICKLRRTSSYEGHRKIHRMRNECAQTRSRDGGCKIWTQVRQFSCSSSVEGHKCRQDTGNTDKECQNQTYLQLNFSFEQSLKGNPGVWSFIQPTSLDIGHSTWSLRKTKKLIALSQTWSLIFLEHRSGDGIGWQRFARTTHFPSEDDRTSAQRVG